MKRGRWIIAILACSIIIGLKHPVTWFQGAEGKTFRSYPVHTIVDTVNGDTLTIPQIRQRIRWALQRADNARPELEAMEDHLRIALEAIDLLDRVAYVNMILRDSIATLNDSLAKLSPPTDTAAPPDTATDQTAVGVDVVELAPDSARVSVDWDSEGDADEVFVASREGGGSWPGSPFPEPVVADPPAQIMVTRMGEPVRFEVCIGGVGCAWTPEIPAREAVAFQRDSIRFWVTDGTGFTKNLQLQEGETVTVVPVPYDEGTPYVCGSLDDQRGWIEVVAQTGELYWAQADFVPGECSVSLTVTDTTIVKLVTGGTLQLRPVDGSVSDTEALAFLPGGP